ncbi:MAG: FIST N-terminal domain-containing protein [Sporomusaceae bacterium]|nr:FIST N-terminal domain-containing protein [Sporomusaceae bacterium]
MTVMTAISDQKVPKMAVQAIKGQLIEKAPKVVIYFASSNYDPQEISAAMQDAFHDATVFGCTTSGEIISGKMTKGALVAMGFSADILEDIQVEIVPEISTEDHVADAFAAFSTHYGMPAIEFDPEKYVGLVICDGLSRAEEKIMDSIGNITNVTFIGGSAGDDLKFASTYVFANGRAYTDAALLVLMKPKASFDFIKTQSFYETGTKLIATKVDEEKRVVMEFDHKPAIQAYAEAVGQPQVMADQSFMRRPLGLMVGDEPYVRSPQQVNNGSIVFYCNVKEGMEMSVLESTDIIADTTRVIKEKQQDKGEILAILNFNCILRTLQLESEGRMDKYGQIFTNIPTIGFSTYGEAYIGHINQTATMLLFMK